jgi:dolichol-phosphate mannosyltransferase
MILAANSQRIDLSIVIPVFNEEENLEPLLLELEPVLKNLSSSFEVICVDDKSTDKSLQILRQLQNTYPYLLVLSHRLNAGESAAQATGFEYARGKVILTMDADLQNDPADIPALLAALKNDVAAVCGIRRVRKDDLVKKISSRIANCFRNWVTGDLIHDAGCTFRAIRKSALKEIPVFNGLHRFLPTLLRYQGYRVVEIEVNHRPRMHGTSKYGIGNRLWRGLRDCFAMRWFKARSIRGDRVAEDYY